MAEVLHCRHLQCPERGIIKTFDVAIIERIDSDKLIKGQTKIILIVTSEDELFCWNLSSAFAVACRLGRIPSKGFFGRLGPSPDTQYSFEQ